MINVILFGLNIIITILLWRFVIKPSILDYFRDKLFDQRERIRDYYINNKIGLDDKTYISLRDLINGHLRFTEEMSFTQVIHFSYKIERNEELKLYLRTHTGKSFYTDDVELKKFIENSRVISSRILFNYMILSSPILLILLGIISLWYVPYLIICSVKKKITGKLNYFLAVYIHTSRYLSKYIKNDDLEELSVNRSLRSYT